MSEELSPEIENEFNEVFAFRSGEEDSEFRDARLELESIPYDGNTRSRGEDIDPAAYDLIVYYETGGEGYYNKKLARPTWPKGYSGITIGFGYDLGYNKTGPFQELWSPHLENEKINRLSQGIGKRAPRDKSRILAMLPGLSDIVIAWESGREVFRQDSIPRYRKLLHKALPNSVNLPPKCEGALLSLVFNRGSGGFDKDGDRYRELREIKRMVQNGTLEGIPDQFRSMARIWPNLKGLQKRRRAEADLFELGLNEQPAAAQPASPEIASSVPTSTPVPPPPVATASETRSFPPVVPPSRYTPEDQPPVGSTDSVRSATEEPAPGDEESTEPTEAEIEMDKFLDTAEGKFSSETRDGSRAAAYWPTNDENSPDYAHLSQIEAESIFEFSAEDLELLIEANRFDPKGEKDVLVLGIRGCQLAEGGYDAEDRKSVWLNEIRPDHVHFKCAIGFYFRAEGRISLYAGSTVPCPYYMNGYYLRANGKWSPTKIGCNIMPTGCYVSRVGTHSKGRIRPAVRTTDPANLSKDGEVTVLRSKNDLSYGTQDMWDRTVAYDNIHCSYFLNKSQKHGAYFSSAGCTTVRGREKGAKEQWGKFQRVLTSLKMNRRVDYLLLTAKEYAIAADRRANGQTDQAKTELSRLRTGSLSSEVDRLQKKLGFDGTGYFGPATKKALAEYQREHGVRSDGIYSPELDRQFGWGVFRDPSDFT